MNNHFKTTVEIPRIMRGESQEIETLINEEALKSIETQEVKPLFEEIKSPQRQILDEIVLCKILGLKKTEMIEICNSAGELFRQRIERFSKKESAG